ncbi:MAG TPA: DMT family transporter [Dehalococcoidia bacterium]|nr:DMT family transporter [Dehalococcoidia bacterium]
MKSKDAALLVVLSLIWGSAFTMNGVVVDEVSPLTIVAGRLVLAAVLLTASTLIFRGSLAPRSTWGVLFVLAALNNVIPFTLITWAQEHITSSLAATLNATMPLMTFVIAAIAGTERPETDRAFGVAIGFVGAIVLIGPDLGEITSSSGLGDLAVLAGSMSYAASTVIARQKLRGDPMALASGQMIFGALIALPLALAIDGAPDLSISAKAGLSWIGLGVLSSGLAYVIFFALVQRMSATSVSLVSYLIPVVATVLGWALLDEHIGVNLFIGLALIIAGMVLVNGTLRRRAGPDTAEIGAAGASATGD